MRETGSARRRWGRWLGALVALAVSFTGVGLAQVPTAAEAITGADFDPGFIISDTQFYDYNAMTMSQIQAFLDAKCATTCINNITTTTSDRAATNMCPNPYVGQVNEPTASIIYNVQRSCGISARVILVMLQKETSLVTRGSPSDTTLRKAMGYACPDSGVCDSLYYGLFNQIYSAASQLKRYGLRTSDNISFRTKYQIGVPYPILYHPNTACGTQTVTVRNMATTALYYYTPYTPNASALSNLGGVAPDPSCASYGNRNFWVFYNNWFGDPHWTVPQGVAVSRLGGNDRYDVAVGISQRNFPGTASVVYVATGSNYPDALSAAPAAALQNAPLLLVPSDSLPATVKAEIQRLAPTQIVVAGGPASVSEGVYNQLAALTTSIRRETGATRYEVATSVIRNAFTSSTTAYIATGGTFPDALSASAAAGFADAPVILVDGVQPALSADVVALLGELGVTNVIIAGGPASVSPSIETQLGTLPGITNVRRVTGADRFIVSGQINHDAFTTSTRVYVASGLTFPDALSGAAVAGAQGAPLYVIPGPCIPSYVLQDIVAFGSTEMVILGGPGSVSSATERFAQCP
jgi:putative cell wall-binding protein